MLQNRRDRRTRRLPAAILATVAAMSIWLWHADGPGTTQSLNGERQPMRHGGRDSLYVRQAARQALKQPAADDHENRSENNQPATSPALTSESDEGSMETYADTYRRGNAPVTTGTLHDPDDRVASKPSTGDDPAITAGQQSYVKIPLRADPGVENLRVGDAEPDVDVRQMPPSKLVEEYRKLSTIQEREEYVAEVMASKRSNATQVLSDLFKAEKSASVKESILSAAASAEQGAELQALLTTALDPAQPVDVRMAALYYASDNAPELIGQYVNDANLDVREEAQNLAESQTNSN